MIESDETIRQVRAQILVERDKLHRLLNKRKDLQLMITFVNTDIKQQEDKIQRLAELPAKLRENNLEEIRKVIESGK